MAASGLATSPPEMLDWEPSENRWLTTSVAFIKDQGLTFSAVGLLLHEVVPGPEGDQVGVVGGGGDGDGPRAPDVGVAQLVSQLLQLVSLEPKHYASLLS